MRISLISLGQTGAGPVYSLEMAEALARSGRCQLQVIISENVSNLQTWKKAFENSNVDFRIIATYKHTKLSVFLNTFNFVRKYRVVRLVKRFDAEVLYIPFGLMWARFVYSFLHKKTKIVATIHDVTPHDMFNMVEKVSSLLNYGAARFVDAYVILNKKDKPIVENRYNKPVAVIPHAAFNYYFSGENKEFKLTRTIGFFGRIEPYKGLDLLVEAFEQCKVEGLKLQIAGSGTVESSLLERIDSNPNILLINRYIKDEEFQQLLDKVDFVVLPYKRASQSGVIPMCFAYGKTVIATKAGALSEQIPEGTGALTNIDAKEIALLIDKLYENPDMIKAMGETAFKYAQEELTWEHSAGLLTDFIRNIINFSK